MSEEALSAELTIGASAIDAYARLSYTMWFALAEFIDNSTQSRRNYGGIIDDVLEQEGQPLVVKIVHRKTEKTITIEDNSIGMNHETLVASLKIAAPTKNSVGRSKYGMGMKTAACWLGKRWQIITTEWGSGLEYTATVDVEAISKHGARVPITVRNVDKSAHGTKIIVSDLRRRIQGRTEPVIQAYLGAMYLFDLRPDAKGDVKLKLTFNGDEVRPPDELVWDVDHTGKPMRQEIKEFEIDGKKVSGWFGVLKKGGRKFGGFSLYQNERQIQGFPDGWKPKSIFGGVDDEGANNLVAQRLTGVLLLEGFEISHTKDRILFEGDEEERLEEFLVKETKDYCDYARRRRGGPGGGVKWSKEKLRDLVNNMRDEFTGPELKDALGNATIPPSSVIDGNSKKQAESVTDDDILDRFQILNDLELVISKKDTSEYEPYVTYWPSADGQSMSVVINLLHPYYATLASDAAIDECVHQYVFDAIAEFKVSKMVGKTNPNSIRTLKDSLLRAIVTGIDNREGDEIDRARDDLNGDDY